MTTTSIIEELEDFEELVEGSSEDYAKYGTYKDTIEILENKYVGSSRWVERHSIVWSENNGERFFRYVYEKPKTEYQEGSEASFDPQRIVEVIPQEVIVVQYVKKS